MGFLAYNGGGGGQVGVFRLVRSEGFERGISGAEEGR